MKTLFLIGACLALVLTIPAAARAGSDVTLAWDANSESDLAGYRLYYGNASGDYAQSVDVGNVTEFTVKDLADGTWYFVVTAYDAAGNESGYSNEVDTALDATAPGAPGNLVIKVIIKIDISP